MVTLNDFVRSGQTSSMTRSSTVGIWSRSACSLCAHTASQLRCHALAECGQQNFGPPSKPLASSSPSAPFPSLSLHPFRLIHSHRSRRWSNSSGRG
eukprot:3244042-Rhodomonas_salina.3